MLSKIFLSITEVIFTPEILITSFLSFQIRNTLLISFIHLICCQLRSEVKICFLGFVEKISEKLLKRFFPHLSETIEILIKLNINNSIKAFNLKERSVSYPFIYIWIYKQYVSVGVLTQTTATLTPTTLKNIEESFMEIIPPQPRPHPQEARFVPPLVNISANYASIQGSIQNQNDMNNNSSNNSNSNTSDLEYGSDYDSEDSSSQSRSSMQWNAYCDKNNSSFNNSNQLSDSNGNNYGQTVTKTYGKTRGKSGRKPMRNEKVFKRMKF